MHCNSCTPNLWPRAFLEAVSLIACAVPRSHLHQQLDKMLQCKQSNVALSHYSLACNQQSPKPPSHDWIVLQAAVCSHCKPCSLAANHYDASTVPVAQSADSEANAQLNPSRTSAIIIACGCSSGYCPILHGLPQLLAAWRKGTSAANKCEVYSRRRNLYPMPVLLCALPSAVGKTIIYCTRLAVHMQVLQVLHVESYNFFCRWTDRSRIHICSHTVWDDKTITHTPQRQRSTVAGMLKAAGASATTSH